MKILCVLSEDDGPEGMFSSDGSVYLGGWHANDATWREYFDPFMKKLGIEIEYSNRKDLRRQLKKIFQ